MRLPFRAARKVTGPSGQAWDLFVTRTPSPGWKAADIESPLDGFGISGGYGGTPIGVFLEVLLAIPIFLVQDVLWPIVRFFAFLPFAAVKGRRSHAAWIEAINYYPQRETILWTTTTDQVESVLNEIAVGLEEGKIVHPVGAVYSGRRDG